MSIATIKMKPDDANVDIPLGVNVGEFGKHGAAVLTSVSLQKAGSELSDKTPADNILREDAKATATTGTVQQAPTYSAGGGPGGENKYDITLNTGEGAGFAAGDYLRSQTAGKKGVYKVLAVAGDVVSVHAATGEMDVENGATVEKCTPQGSYESRITVSASDLGVNTHAYLRVEYDFQASADRTSANDPAFLNSKNTLDFIEIEIETDAGSYSVA